MFGVASTTLVERLTISVFSKSLRTRLIHRLYKAPSEQERRGRRQGDYMAFTALPWKY